MMRYHDGGWGPGAWIAMAFVMVVFWGVVVTAIVRRTRYASPADRTSYADDE